LLKVNVKAIFFCIECKLKLCGECKEYHYSKLKTTHKESSFSKVEEINLSQYYCLEHKKLFEVLCVDCEILICFDCMFNHPSHEKVKYSVAEEKIIEINKKNENKIDKKILFYKINIKKCKENEKNYYNQIKMYENKIIENKNEEKEFNFNLQKILNVKTIIKEKPLQFMLDFKNINEFYGFGKNYFYQLGTKDDINRNELTKINFFQKIGIKSIVLGGVHTFIFSSKFLIKLREW
jgi:hypothetical protein